MTFYLYTLATQPSGVWPSKKWYLQNENVSIVTLFHFAFQSVYGIKKKGRNAVCKSWTLCAI